MYKSEPRGNGRKLNIIEMNIQELEKWLQKLKSGRIKVGKISRQESLNLIIDAMNYLSKHGYNSDSHARIESNLHMIEFYDDMVKKYDVAIEAVQLEIDGLKS